MAAAAVATEEVVVETVTPEVADTLEEVVVDMAAAAAAVTAVAAVTACQTLVMVSRNKAGVSKMPSSILIHC